VLALSNGDRKKREQPQVQWERFSTKKPSRVGGVRSSDETKGSASKNNIHVEEARKKEDEAANSQRRDKEIKKIEEATLDGRGFQGRGPKS